jgi:hypothetical protein
LQYARQAILKTHLQIADQVDQLAIGAECHSRLKMLNR